MLDSRPKQSGHLPDDRGFTPDDAQSDDFAFAGTLPRATTPSDRWSRWREHWPLALGIGLGALFVGAAIFHYTVFLPQLTKPTKFYLLDSVFELGIAALIALSSATIGAWLLRHFPRGHLSRLERALVAYGLGTGALALVTAAIGLAHGYYFPILAALLVAPLVLWRRDLRDVTRALMPREPSFIFAELRPRNVAESTIAAICLMIGALIAEHSLVPFWGFDVFMYHFALPKRFLALHQLFGSPGLPQANLPYNNEMLNLLALNFQAEVGAAIVQTVFVGAMCLATFAIGVRLLSRPAAWLGMALLLAAPIAFYYASSGLIDQQFAFVTLVAIVVLLEYRDSHDRAWVVLAGLLIGIGFGVKYQTVYLIAPMMVPLIGWSRPRTSPSTRRDWARSVAINLALLAICAGGAFALWAIREWVQVGNPVYPLIWGGAEWSPDRMLFYSSQFDNFGSLRHSALRFVVPVFDWFIHWGKYDYTPLPPIPAYALALGAPFVALGRGVVAQRRRGGIVLLGWLCLTSLALWSLVNQLVPRYVLPTFGLLALLAAAAICQGVSWLGRSRSASGRDVLLAIVGVVVLLPGVLFAVQSREQSDPYPVYTGQQSYQAYLEATQMWPSYWRTATMLNTQVPLDAKIYCVNLAAGYFFDDPYITPDMNRDGIFYLSHIAPSDAQKLAWLRAHDYHYLIYDRTVTLWSQARDPDNLLTPLVQPFEAFLDRQLILVRSLDGTDVYLIPPTTPGGA